MSTTTSFLKPENAALAERLMDESGFEFNAFLRWWDEEKLQIDGDLSLVELRKLVEIMDGFKQSERDGVLKQADYALSADAEIKRLKEALLEIAEILRVATELGAYSLCLSRIVGEALHPKDWAKN